MREIKFRAWLGNAGEWIEANQSFEGEMTYDLAFEEYEPINDQLKSVDTLMQYTGLKDKNGVEIYEGDIVKHPDFEVLGNLVISFQDGCTFMNGWDCIRTEFNLCKVIGNIYENPELLK